MRVLHQFVLPVASVSAIFLFSAGLELNAAARNAPEAASTPLPAIASSPQRAVDTSLEQTLLSRARENSASLASALTNFICRERIERFRAAHGENIGKQIDVITSNVSFEGGAERYSDIFQNKKARRSISSISGAWSEGEYATF